MSIRAYMATVFGLSSLALCAGCASGGRSELHTGAGFYERDTAATGSRLDAEPPRPAGDADRTPGNPDRSTAPDATG